MEEVPNSVLQSCALYEFKSGLKPTEAAAKICLVFGDASISDTILQWFERFYSGDETIDDNESNTPPKKKKAKLKYDSPSISKKIIRACLLYEYRQTGVKAAEATRKICLAFGNGAVSERCSRAWFQKFAFGLETLVDAPRSGRPSFLNDSKLKDAIEANAKQTCQNLAEQFNVCDETIRNHLHRLGKSWKLNEWLPKEISPANKQARLNICSALLSRYKSEDFIDRLLTYGETWAQYKNIKCSPENLTYDDGSEKQQQPKLFICIWWTSKGIVHSELSETTVAYVEQLKRVSTEVKDNSMISDSKTVLFQHETERLHSAKEFNRELNRLGWEVLPHPPFSSDVMPSDFYIFPALENYLRHKVLSKRTDVESEVKKFFQTRETDFFKKGLEELPKRWEKIIDANGEYLTK